VHFALTQHIGDQRTAACLLAASRTRIRGSNLGLHLLFELRFCAARCSSVISCPESLIFLSLLPVITTVGSFALALGRRLRVFVREQDGQHDHDGDADNDVGLGPVWESCLPA